PSSATFQPATISPDINSLPALKAKNFTFGSFNRLSKVNDDVLNTWAQILHKTTNSRLLLGHIQGAGMRNQITERFEKFGISSDRLLLQERTSMQKYLQTHHQVDLLLDSFPYS